MYEIGTITGAVNQAVVNGSGTKWATKALGIVPGSLLMVYRAGYTDTYAIKTVDSDTKITLTRNITTGISNSGYGIVTSETASTSSFANQLSDAFATWRKVVAGWSTALTGTGDVTLEDPMTGNKVTVPTLSTIGNKVDKNSSANLSSIELSHDTPFIDFHFGKSTSDYNVRLINNGDNLLTCNGNFKVWGEIQSDRTIRSLTESNATSGVISSAGMEASLVTAGKKLVTLIGSRHVWGQDNYGFISYHDWEGNWNEVRIRAGSVLDIAGQYITRTKGWGFVKGSETVDSSPTWATNNGLLLYGRSSAWNVGFSHSEQIGSWTQASITLNEDNANIHIGFAFRNNGVGYSNNGWQTYSDRRVKDDLKEISKPLEKILKLKAYSYLKNGDSFRSASIMAQDLQAVLPEGVTDTGTFTKRDGTVVEHCLAVSNEAVIGLLVGAVGEMNKKLSERDQRIVSLEGAVNALLSKVEVNEVA
jgi:hypothetical protein